MTFTARLKKSSHIHSAWRGARRIQGVVGNAVFRLAPGFEYVTQALTPEQIEELRHHPSVQIEMVAVPPTLVDDVLSYERDDPSMPIRGVMPGEPANPLAAQMPGFTTIPSPVRSDHSHQRQQQHRHKGRR